MAPVGRRRAAGDRPEGGRADGAERQHQHPAAHSGPQAPGPEHHRVSTASLKSSYSFLIPALLPKLKGMIAAMGRDKSGRHFSLGSGFEELLNLERMLR